MEEKKKGHSALWLLVFAGATAICAVVALLSGLHTGAEPAAQDKQVVESGCTLLQTIRYTRCGHEVTRRIAADKEYQGADLKQMQQAFADWTITSFSANEIAMSCALPLYCPDHLVVLPDGAGVLGVYQNVYGDGYALQKQLEAPLSELGESVLETIHLGLPFESMQQIESWLETLES